MRCSRSLLYRCLRLSINESCRWGDALAWQGSVRQTQQTHGRQCEVVLPEKAQKEHGNSKCDPKKGEKEEKLTGFRRSSVHIQPRQPRQASSHNGCKETEPSRIQDPFSTCPECLCKLCCFCAKGVQAQNPAPQMLHSLCSPPPFFFLLFDIAGYLRHFLDTPCWHCTPHKSIAFRFQRHGVRINSGTRRSP